MKVLITGITGNVGSHLADYILNNHQNVELHGIARWRSPMDNIEKIKHKINIELADLNDLSSLDDTEDPHTVSAHIEICAYIEKSHIKFGFLRL